MHPLWIPKSLPKTKDKIHVTNYCIFYIKYYIYIQKLFNKNHLDVYSCQLQLKHAIEIEYEICNKNKTLVTFDKFNFIYNNFEYYIYQHVQYLSKYMFRNMSVKILFNYI